jgi:DUF4097 and DUF4098 domain-containing protein YvlB
MGKKFLIASAVLGLMVISAFSGCIEDTGDKIVSQSFNGEYNTNQNTSLKVTNSNGDVKINT